MITITTSEIDYFKREPYKKERLAFTKHGNKLKLIKLKKGQRYPPLLVYEPPDYKIKIGIVRLADPRKHHITDFAAQVGYGHEGCTNRCSICKSWETCRDFFYSTKLLPSTESELPYDIYFDIVGKDHGDHGTIFPPSVRVWVDYLRLVIPVILSPTNPYIPEHIWVRVLHRKPIKRFSAVKKFLADNYNTLMSNWNQGEEDYTDVWFEDGDYAKFCLRDYCEKHKQEFLQWKED